MFNKKVYFKSFALLLGQTSYIMSKYPTDVSLKYRTTTQLSCFLLLAVWKTFLTLFFTLMDKFHKCMLHGIKRHFSSSATRQFLPVCCLPLTVDQRTTRPL